MKKTLKLFIFSLIIISSFSNFLFGQVEKETIPRIDLNLGIGIFFPQSNYFQSYYQTKSTFNWNIGTTFGDMNGGAFPWLKFSHTQAKVDTLFQAFTPNDSLLILRKKQLAFGIEIPLKITDNNFIIIQSGLSYNLVNESFEKMQADNFGLILSLGYRKRFSETFAFSINLTYDYYQKHAFQFKDLSGYLITTGISLNLAAD
ncbi:MAG: hypothetical protein HOA61_01695 [Bacteroidetes bacterium]|nr:hypothetical protein [Bacteroidota bacterium]